VGLTGGLGSGKSTVAGMLVEKGAKVLFADEIGRSLMEPGTAVYDRIVEKFGQRVVLEDETLDRPELAKIAFAEGHVEELNAIVHPATIAKQAEMMAEFFEREPDAIVVVESALVFETKHSEGWRDRFDRMVLVSAPDWMKVERFVNRSGGGDEKALRVEAKRRLAQMIPDEAKARQCDFVLVNDGSLEQLKPQVEALWQNLIR
jgi:dephospho-CoA kinase